MKKKKKEEKKKKKKKEKKKRKQNRNYTSLIFERHLFFWPCGSLIDTVKGVHVSIFLTLCSRRTLKVCSSSSSVYN